MTETTDRPAVTIRAVLRSATRTRFDRILLVVIGLGMVSIAANLFLPQGAFLPAWLLIPQVLVIAVMLLMHITRVLGVRAMIVYFVTMMALELVSEYVDIATDGGWYGAHFAYTSLWGPQLFGVPIVPPVSIAVLVWPAFCAASIILCGDYSVDHRGRSWLTTISVALIAGMFVSWMPVIYEAICIKIGAYTYPQIESGQVAGYWGSPIGSDHMAMPLRVFPGFTLLVFLQVVVLTRVIGPRAAGARLARADSLPPLHPILDLAPLAFFVMLAVGLTKVGSTVEAQVFGAYTGVLGSVLAVMCFYLRGSGIRRSLRIDRPPVPPGRPSAADIGAGVRPGEADGPDRG